MKRIILSFLLASFALLSFAQTLTFNKNGKFKIVQFTDVHYIADDPRADIALERIAEVVDAEHPDLVVFTGDVIFGKPAGKSMQTVLDVVSKRKYPFAVIFGNHDYEYDMTREQLYEEIIKKTPYNLSSTTKGITGVSNYILPIYSSKEKNIAEVLYFFDSHADCRIKGVEGYDYLAFDQINWYREQSKKYTHDNNGVPVNALAFIHIPLQEYNMASSSENTQIYGIRREKACSSNLNSGLFASIKEMGDVRAIFAGHDHNNDYAACWYGVLLAYGRYTGGNTVYNDLPNGARIIELTEGSKKIKSYIRTANNHIEQETVFPDSFIKK